MFSLKNTTGFKHLHWDGEGVKAALTIGRPEFNKVHRGNAGVVKATRDKKSYSITAVESFSIMEYITLFAFITVNTEDLTKKK